MTDNSEIILMICRRIKMTRIEKNLSQAELANLSNLGIATIKRIESGCSLSVSTLISILRGLGELDQLDNLLAYCEYNGHKDNSPKRKRRLDKTSATTDTPLDELEYDFVTSQPNIMRWKY